MQRAKSGLGEAPLGASGEGKGGRLHSMLSSHLQSGGRKNSITGVTKRHLGALQLFESRLQRSSPFDVGQHFELHPMLLSALRGVP